MSKGFFGRHDRLIQEKSHDVYLGVCKVADPSLCTVCGVVYESGRWVWKAASVNAGSAVCPACRRIADMYPAGFIEIKGSFFSEHKQEILNLVRNIEALEKGEHPLERIMNIKEQNNHTLVTTTGIHIARRIGEALSRSYKGEYSFHYIDSDNIIRVYWER